MTSPHDASTFEPASETARLEAEVRALRGLLVALAASHDSEDSANARLLATIQAQAGREALLNRITTDIRESLELADMFDTAVRVVGESLDACRCYIWFVNSGRRTFSIGHEYCAPGIASVIGEYPIEIYGEQILKRIVEDRLLVVDDVECDPRVDTFRDALLTPLGVRSLVYVPIMRDGKFHAGLGISQVRRARTWTSDDVALMQGVASQIGVAMRQAGFDRQRKRAEYRALVNRVSTAIRSSLELDTILETTVVELGQALGVDRCFVLAPGPFPSSVETSMVRFEYCREGVMGVKGIKMPVRNRAREGPVVGREQPLVIPDFDHTPRFVSRRKADLLELTETRALLCVRATHADQVLAIIELTQCTGPREWAPDEVQLVVEIADHVALSVHNALLFRRITGSERQWHTTFNSMTDGLALLDPTGLVMRINDSMLRLCRLPNPQEAIGHACYELLYGKEHGPHDRLLERVLATGQRAQIERNIPARGIALRESIDPIFDENEEITGLILVVRDVTREREADRAIRYRNRQLGLNAIAAATTQTYELNKILEGAFGIIMDVTAADAGAILILDQERVRLDPTVTHGGAARAAALVGRDPSTPSVRFLLEAEAPLTLDEIASIAGIAAPNEPPTGPPDDEGNGGAPQPALRAGLLAPIRSQRQAIGILAIAYVQERGFSANERQLLAVAGKQIGVAVESARLIANLQQALERVQEANRLKDEFLATVSHELRTPLTAIQGWAEVLGDPELGPAEMAEGLSTIQQSSESLTQLISDLIEMSRIENRMLRLEKAVIDPNYPVLAAVQTVRQIADSKGVAIETSLGERLPSIEGDPGRLQQVMWNLLTNSIKFTPAGGWIRVESTMPEAGRVCFRVVDNGIGIESDFLPHVFERFRQADGSTTRLYGGLGIGLSLVKSLVEAHAGTVTVESPGPGLGSTFTVLLPAAEG